MIGKRIGYVRVSSDDQNPDRQLEGVLLDEKFLEKVSAKTLDRPKLQEMLNFARKDDEIFVHSIDRIARNLRDLHKIVDLLTSKGVKITFIKENLFFTGQDDSPMSSLLMNIMGSFAEFERALIHERQAEGIRLAKAKGKYIGRTKVFSDEQKLEVKKLLELGVPKVNIAKKFGVSRYSVWRYANAN